MRTRLMAGILLAVASAGAQYGTPQRPLDVPYVPSPNPVVEAMLRLAAVKDTDTVYDLGCGDGRIVITAAKSFGAHGVGVDLNPERIEEATANATKAGVAGLVKFEENDLFKADISAASVVTLYLLPDVNNRLKPKLLRDLKPGTRVVSHSFDMGEWKPDKEEIVDGKHIYLWVIPKK
jgi:SAM-dependent methyltransferase